MPLSTLDPKAALILIDLQKGIVGMVPEDVAKQVVGNGARLAAAFRQRGLPVVLVNVNGSAPGRIDGTPINIAGMPPDWIELLPELNQQTSDIRITKQRRGAFLGTSLHETLQKHGVTQVLIGGVATGAGVESTGRSASDLGYNVVFIADAMADRDPATHSFCIETAFPRTGEVTDTVAVLAKLG